MLEKKDLFLMPYALGYQRLEDTGLVCDFTSQFLDGDKRKVKPVKHDLKKDFHIDDGQPIFSVITHGLSGALREAVPLETQFIPTKKELAPEDKSVSLRTFFNSLPCFVAGGGMNYMACEAFREMVEDLEPGVHQFFPIDIYGTDGKIYARRYYFQILNRVAFLDKEKSEFKMVGSGLELGHYGYGPLYFDFDAVKSLHLWRDKYFGGSVVFFSDELAQRMLDSNLRGIQIIKTKDRPHPVPEKYLGDVNPRMRDKNG